MNFESAHSLNTKRSSRELQENQVGVEDDPEPTGLSANKRRKVESSEDLDLNPHGNLLPPPWCKLNYVQGCMHVSLRVRYVIEAKATIKLQVSPGLFKIIQEKLEGEGWELEYDALGNGDSSVKQIKVPSRFGHSLRSIEASIQHIIESYTKTRCVGPEGSGEQ